MASIPRRQEEDPHGPGPKAIASVTDADSRVLRDKEGRWKPHYDLPLAVDAGPVVIVATGSSGAAEDRGQLTPMLQEYEEHRQRLRVRMDTDIGRERYKLRRQTVEPRFGLIPGRVVVKGLRHLPAPRRRPEHRPVNQNTKVAPSYGRWEQHAR